MRGGHTEIMLLRGAHTKTVLMLGGTRVYYTVVICQEKVFPELRGGIQALNFQNKRTFWLGFEALDP